MTDAGWLMDRAARARCVDVAARSLAWLSDDEFVQEYDSDVLYLAQAACDERCADALGSAVLDHLNRPDRIANPDRLVLAALSAVGYRRPLAADLGALREVGVSGEVLAFAAAVQGGEEALGRFVAGYHADTRRWSRQLSVGEIVRMIRGLPPELRRRALHPDDRIERDSPLAVALELLRAEAQDSGSTRPVNE